MVFAIWSNELVLFAFIWLLISQYMQRVRVKGLKLSYFSVQLDEAEQLTNV